jgi:hypothetical protein
MEKKLRAAVQRHSSNCQPGNSKHLADGLPAEPVALHKGIGKSSPVGWAKARSSKSAVAEMM